MAEMKDPIKKIFDESLPDEAKRIGIARETMEEMAAYCDATGESVNDLLSRYIHDPGEVLVMLEAFTAQQDAKPN